ncbi:ParA family protein, partial [Mycolicibacterium mageritense]|uniref:ParA family protein n=1 Tax=Mycolicibacterium mageritense TaxID=53462 RepID=UPI001E657627
MTSDIDPPKLAAARVLAIAMQKGGVSKTTTAVNVATALADLGYRVLVIDMDQQAHCTMSLRVDLGPDDASLYEVLHPDRALRVPLRNVIKRSEFGVDVAPAHMALRELERTGLGSGGQLRLARELDSVIDDYDFVLLDCPPALGELTTAALAAADDVLAVLKPGGFEVSSMRELANT